MPPTVDEPVDASQEWLTAQKIRRVLLQELERVKKSASEGSEIEHFKKLDDLMAQYRLKCMVILYCDIEYASKEKVETTLWTTHVLVNSAYRKVKEKYERLQKAVTRRNVEKLYDGFIKTTQSFYKTHLQHFCARYPDLPELQRLVAGGAVDKFEGLRDTARIDAVATGVKDQVLNSAYLTLNYLGDLWRYRTQLRHRERRKYDAALAYYRLATDLDPRSGYAYHQMGVIFLEQEKHFDIVYHFYRSLAAEEPHPNAAKNLGNEFNRVLQPSASPRGQGPHHALQDWVVRLHAHFYRGREFPQHAELEEEVLHRFALAVKAHDFVDGLLKVALTNICAYQVAKDRITAEWTAERSQTCQFALRLNVRTIYVILHQLENELPEMVNLMRSNADQPNGAGGESSRTDDGSKFNALVTDALPLLRVYMTWLCMYRSDIVQFELHLQPYVVQMYKSLSAVLSSLFEVLRHYLSKEPVPYLFEEDMETFGLKALNGPAIPPACLLGIDSITLKSKLRPEGAGNRVNFKPDDFSFTRTLDITTCGFALADDPDFPLEITQTEASDGEHLVRAVYVAEGKRPSSTAAASKVAAAYSSPSTTAAGLSAMLDSRPSPIGAAIEPASRSVSANTPNLASVTNGFAEALTLHGGQQAPVSASLAISPYAPQMAEESNYAVDHDSRMHDLVNGLVEPSESDASPSYGMHTATARDVFASALPVTGPRLTSSRSALLSLPWSWDAIGKPPSHQQGIPSASPQSSWPAPTTAPQPISNRNSLGGVLPYSPSHTSSPFATGISAQYANDYQTTTASATSSGHDIWNHARLRSFGNEGSSSAAGLPGHTSYEYAPNANDRWAEGSSKFSSLQDILG